MTEIVGREGDCVRLNLGFLRICILNHPDAIRHVLQTNYQNYSKDTFQYNLLAEITGKGLLTSDGDFWLRQRRLIQPAFHRRYFSIWKDIIYSATNKMIERWEVQIRRDSQLDIEGEMMDLALEIVLQALFGVDHLDTKDEIIESTLTVLEHIVFRARNPFDLQQIIPGRREKRFRQASIRLNKAVSQIIQKYKQRAAANLPDDNGSANVITLLLRGDEDQGSSGMSDRQLRDEIITLLIAGHETVASALSWSIYLLSRQPDIQSRLREEVLTNMALRNQTNPQPDVSPLAFRVFSESLRLYPPAWIITRKAIAADTIPLQPPFHVPPRALVVISPYLIHRHPDYWENPDEFQPDRFADPQENTRHRFTYIPFGAGPRLCIGEGLALLEGPLVLSLLVQNFSFFSPHQPEILPDPAVTLRARHGMRLRVVFVPLPALE